MGEYDLNYFVGKEQEGTIFSKISKSSSDVRGKGVFFLIMIMLERLLNVNILIK